MLRTVHLVLLLFMVVLVASLEEVIEPVREVEPPVNNANDLDTDASSWGYSRPWRYGWGWDGGWKSGWKGWQGGWGWGGKGWIGRGGWW